MRNFKKFLTLVLAVMMVVSSFAFSTSAATTKFEDVDASNETLVNAVDLLNYMGIAKGKSETNFGADENVTREQFALFMYRLMKGGKDAPKATANASKFTDLEDSTYFYAIAWAAAEGIVNGTSATTYSPKDTITLQEAYTMIVRALDWEQEEKLSYPFGYIQVAEQKNVELDRGLPSDISYLDELTRGDMAILLYNAFFAETGEEEVYIIKDGDKYQETTTHNRLCEIAFDVVEVNYQVEATPSYQKGATGSEEATYDLGYDAAYLEVLMDKTYGEIDPDKKLDVPAAAYLTAEELGVEEGTLDEYFLGHFTLFVTLVEGDKEIDKVLFSDCNMVKKTVTELKLGEVTSNKADSYFTTANPAFTGTAGSNVDAAGNPEFIYHEKLLSGKISTADEDIYAFNAPYSYANPSYGTRDSDAKKYYLRNQENVDFIEFTVDEKDGVDVYTMDYASALTEVVYPVTYTNSNNEEVTVYVDDNSHAQAVSGRTAIGLKENFKTQATELVEKLANVYFDGLYAADLYDVNGDGIYDYMNYKPYKFFQVLTDENYDYTDSKDLSTNVPKIYVNEAILVSDTVEEVNDEDYVIGYFHDDGAGNLDSKVVEIAAVIEPTVSKVANFRKGTGIVYLENGDEVDGVSAWRLVENNANRLNVLSPVVTTGTFFEKIGYDIEAYNEAVVIDSAATNGLFSDAAIDNDDLNFYIYDGVILYSDVADVNRQYTENLIIPLLDGSVKPGVRDGFAYTTNGDEVVYVYAYVDGDAKYVPVAIDEDERLPIAVMSGGSYVPANTSAYDGKLCTYSVDADGVYTIKSLQGALDANGNPDNLNASYTSMSDALDDTKKENQYYYEVTSPKFEKVAGSRFEIEGTTNAFRDVDLKSYSVVVINEHVDKNGIAADGREARKFHTLSDSDLTRSITSTLTNMSVIVSNNTDSKVRENLVVLYAEAPNGLNFQGSKDKDGYRIIKNTPDLGIDDDGTWRYYYSVYNPYTGKVEYDVPGTKATKRANQVASASANLTAGSIVNLEDGFVNNDSAASILAKFDVANDITNDKLVAVADINLEEGYIQLVPYGSTLAAMTCKGQVADTIDALASSSATSIKDLYTGAAVQVPDDNGALQNATIFDIDSDTTFVVINYGNTTDMFNYGSIELVKAEDLVDPGKNLLNYNDSIVTGVNNDKLTTKYADYVRGYASIDTLVKNGDNGVLEFMVIIVTDEDESAKDVCACTPSHK